MCQFTCVSKYSIFIYTLRPKYTSARPSIWKLSHTVCQRALCFCKITSQTWHGMTLVHTLVHGAIQASHIFNQIKYSCWKWRWNWITALETSSWISCNKQVPLKERHTFECKHTHFVSTVMSHTHMQPTFPPCRRHIYLWAQLKAWNLNMLR